MKFFVTREDELLEGAMCNHYWLRQTIIYLPVTANVPHKVVGVLYRKSGNGYTVEELHLEGGNILKFPCEGTIWIAASPLPHPLCDEVHQGYPMEVQVS